LQKNPKKEKYNKKINKHYSTLSPRKQIKIKIRMKIEKCTAVPRRVLLAR